jgi:hypothetical protein
MLLPALEYCFELQVMRWLFFSRYCEYFQVQAREEIKVKGGISFERSYPGAHSVNFAYILLVRTGSYNYS